MEAVDVLGCLEGGLVFYRIIGKQGIDYDLWVHYRTGVALNGGSWSGTLSETSQRTVRRRILVTDFQGRSWRASFALQDVFDALVGVLRPPVSISLFQWARHKASLHI